MKITTTILFAALCCTTADATRASHVETVSSSPVPSPIAMHCNGIAEAGHGPLNLSYADLHTVVVGIDETTSAYDVAENRPLRTRIGKGLDTLFLGQAFAAGKTAYALPGLCGASIRGVAITFADSSKIYYSRSSGNTAALSFAYVEGSAMTAHLQIIPEANTPENQGIWYGHSQGGDDMDRFARHMHALGATLVDYPGHAWSTPNLVHCRWMKTDQGSNLVCTASP